MKKLYFILFFLPLFGFSQNQWQIGLYAGSYSPFKSQMPKMSTTYGTGFHFGYKPSAFLPFSFDWSSTFGTYYYGTQQETYIFDEFSSTTTNVTYSSKMRTHLLGARVNLTNDYSPIKPYIKPQFGWSTMKSKIVIADPNDVDDCQPLDKQTNNAFRGPVYGGEVGIEVDMERMFRNVSQPNKHYLFVSASYLRGFSKFEYINQKYMTSHDHSAMPAGSHDMGNEDGRDITTSFVNVTTNEIHDHKIAELYRTPFEMWGIKIGYVVYF